MCVQSPAGTSRHRRYYRIGGNFDEFRRVGRGKAKKAREVRYEARTGLREALTNLGARRGTRSSDALEALLRSVSEKAAKRAKKPRKASSAQKEMLMPIAGKKAANQAAAKKPTGRPQRKVG